MNRLIIACLLATIITSTTSALGGASCPDDESPFPAPASEVAEIISEWLKDQEFWVQRSYPRPGYIHLTARRPQDEWKITVRPQSLLGSVSTMIYEGASPSKQACHQLQEYVDGYLFGNTSSPPTPQVGPYEKIVPTVVLNRIETVVCIRTQSGEQEVQFSGFLVDSDGLVLCTAHNLTSQQDVTLTFYDGTRLPGIVSRIDLRLDLALVECSINDWPFVSLSTGRNLLGMGESVFSIGCPNNLRGTLASGTINGPPRLVKDQPLWQVKMDIYPGSSGSPVFDAQGQLVAMVKGRYRGTSMMGFLTPLETIISFLLNNEL